MEIQPIVDDLCLAVCHAHLYQLQVNFSKQYTLIHWLLAPCHRPEAMGLTPEGQGKRAILEGWTEKDGKLPINPSGGLKSKGHPIGATGVSMHIMASMQVRGEAADMQVKDAKMAGVFNMGGAAVANFVSILEPLR